MACRRLQHSHSVRRLALPAITLVLILPASVYFYVVHLHPAKTLAPAELLAPAVPRAPAVPHALAAVPHAPELAFAPAVPHVRAVPLAPAVPLATAVPFAPAVPLAQAVPLNNVSKHQQRQDHLSTSLVSVGDFLTKVAARASSQGDILFAYVDIAFIDMAFNFVGTSLRRHNITNYLFISSDLACCQLLQRSGLACHVHKLDGMANKASAYGSKDFIRKMNYRTDVILLALENGYSVLHTDTDVVFLRDPFDYLRALVCDIAVMVEKPGLYNAGFLFVRPTNAGVAVYRRMRVEAVSHPLMDDQMQLNFAIKILWSAVTVIALPSTLFASGLAYFEMPGRVFAARDLHTNHYVIHNNWIVSKAAKVYRFKEHLMWIQDDNKYYSDATRRYLTYDNPPLGGDKMPSVYDQWGALSSALAIGLTLNRTVILPAFRCAGKKMCALNSILRVTLFDGIFADNYREHVFLSHPMVPKSVKESRSDTFLILSTACAAIRHRENMRVFTPENQISGASSLEISSWFQDVKDAVLSFHCLYGAFDRFTDRTDQDTFEQRTRKAFKLASYRQYR